MKRAVFLDRDGVINEVLTSRVKFVNKPKDLYFLPQVPEAIKKLNKHFDYVFVVTNQGGVGLGFMKETSLQKIHEHMVKELKKKAPLSMRSFIVHISLGRAVLAESPIVN